LILTNVAMIAADTTRTKHYLDKLIKASLFPAYVLVLLNDEKKLLPGQKDRLTKNVILNLLDNSKIKYDIAPNKSINNPEVAPFISNRDERVFIFSGFGGELIGSDLLNINKEFLHVHGGYLPDYKGSTANYFSLIDDNYLGASSIFITKEIDCGPVLLRRKFPPPKDRSKIDYAHDSEVRAEVLIQTLKKYLKSGNWNIELEENIGGETYFIIHPVLKHLAILG
jgi:methionyl-tRNA formyltransferase